MNNLTKATILTGALFAPFAANAVSITWISGNQEISGNIYYTQDGMYGFGEVSSIVNTDTSAVEYQAGVNPGYITYLIDASPASGQVITSAPSVNGLGDLTYQSVGGTLTFYQSATNINPLVTLSNFTVNDATQDLQAQNLVEHSSLSGAGPMNSVWLDGIVNPTTPVTTTLSTYEPTYKDSFGVTCGPKGVANPNIMDPNCYKFLAEAGTYQWSVNNTGYPFANPLSYDTQATNIATWNTKDSLGFQNNAGNNVIGVNIPEPSTLAILGMGALGLGVVGRRRKA